MKPYLNPTDFKSDNCDRHCFQNFQYATHDFYSTCRPQLSSKVPMASLMSAFQEYRNQACCESLFLHFVTIDLAVNLSRVF